MDASRRVRCGHRGGFRWLRHERPGTFAWTAGLVCVVVVGLAPPARARPPSSELHIVVPDGYLPGVAAGTWCNSEAIPSIPVLVRAEIRSIEGGGIDRSVWDAEVELSTPTPGASLSPNTITLRNGLGSTLVSITAEAGSDVTIMAMVVSASDPDAFIVPAQKTLSSLSDLPSDSVACVSGDLSDDQLEWSGIVLVTADTRVPDGKRLVVGPGTLVLLQGVPSGEGGADLNVEGAITCNGTADRPVTFTAVDPAEPWGEIDHDGAEPSLYQYVMVTRAGHSPRGGHTNTGPAIRPHGGSEITFENTSVADNVGKLMQASSADLTFRECELARSVMGPEISGTALDFDRSWLTGMYGEVANDGNDGDGIYVHDQGDRDVTIRGSVVAETTDDGIDTLGAEVLIEDTVVRDMRCDKGISVFGGTVTVRRCVLANNDKGISAKSTGSSRVFVEHCTFSGNRWCMESRNKSNAQSPNNYYDISNCIVRHNNAEDGSEDGCESNEPIGGRSIRTDFSPDYFEIRYSDLEPDFQIEGEYYDTWPGPAEQYTNNIGDDPRFMEPASGDYQLQSSSPCIDAADPTADPDPDGSRADMGAIPFTHDGSFPVRFVRGEVNGDGEVDLSDPISLLLWLYVVGGDPLSCEDAADANDDGELDQSDAIYVLAYLFQGVDPPLPPGGPCVEDTTDDDPLTCSVSDCP